MTLIFAARPVQAARVSGNYLLEMCAANEKGEELIKGGHAVCQSYIAAVIDYHNLMRTMGVGPSINFCVPEGTTMNDIQVVVARYLLRNKDEHGSFVAAPGVAIALFQAYPCKRKGK